MKITVDKFGSIDKVGTVLQYTLENNSGIKVQILNYGAIIRSIIAPDRNGKLDDIVLGYDDLESYINGAEYFGAVIGRNCNRIKNAEINLFGESFCLEKNSGENNLHSGRFGLFSCLFSSEVHSYNNMPVLLLSYKLKDLQDGFPGNLTVNLTYLLSDDNSLMIDYRAVSDQTSIINLTNHSYFNLAGHSSGSIYGHNLSIAGRFYTPTTSDGIPTGEILSVSGTALDFISEKAVGKDISSSYPQIHQFGGYDHNYVLDGIDYRKIASLSEPQSGRRLEVYSDLPGLQLYTANSLSKATPSKDGALYTKHDGLCLETQFFPNSANMPWFPSPIFAAGEEFASTTAFLFSTF